MNTWNQYPSGEAAAAAYEANVRSQEEAAGILPTDPLVKAFVDALELDDDGVFHMTRPAS